MFFAWIKPQCGFGASTTSPVRREQTTTPKGGTIRGIAPSPKRDLDTRLLQIGLQQGDTENVFAQITGGVPPPPHKAKYVKKDETVQRYLQRWMSPPQSDIDHNNVIDTPRLWHIRAHLVCK